MLTPDVNVLLAASRSDHPHHPVALAWLQQTLGDCGGGQILAILPMVAAGFLRLATHPRVFIEPTPMAAALDFLRAVCSAPGVTIPALGGEWETFTRLCAKHALSGNDIPDAWIAAAVLHHHLHLVTFDKGFRRWLKARRLTVLKGAAA